MIQTILRAGHQGRPGRLAARCPDAELWLRPDDGHVSVLGSCGVAALDWLVAYA